MAAWPPLPRPAEPSLTFRKMPFVKLHIWEVATWEIVTWEVALGKRPLGKYLTPLDSLKDTVTSTKLKTVEAVN